MLCGSLIHESKQHESLLCFLQGFILPAHALAHGIANCGSPLLSSLLTSQKHDRNTVFTGSGWKSEQKKKEEEEG